MLLWSIVATDFNTWLALGVLAGVVCVVIVAVAAFVFPEPPARSVPGVAGQRQRWRHPVLKIVAPLSIWSCCS